MKIATTIIGFFITILLLIGVEFKIMHWPGASISIILSVSALSMYVFLVAIANINKYKDNTLLKVCNGFGGFSSSILAIGLLFKIMHWPGAQMMLFAGLLLGSFVLLMFVVAYLKDDQPIFLSPGTFFSAIAFSILIYGVSVGGATRSLLVNITSNADKIESNTEMIILQNLKLSLEKGSSNTSKISAAVEELTHHINVLKSKLYVEIDMIPKVVADTISLSHVAGKDNYDMPSYVMGISNPNNPIKSKYSAITLREKIEKFNSIASEINPDIKLINIQANHYSGYLDTWEVESFYHMPLVNVVLTLNQIQLEANIIYNAILVSEPTSSIKESITK